MADPSQVMPEIEYQTHDNTARIALVALAVILALLGLLYLSSVKVTEQRANPDAYAEVAPGGALHQFTAYLHGKGTEIRESDSTVGKSILGVGTVIMLGSALWCGFAALGVSVGWGIAVWCTPWIGMLVFCSIYWEEGQGPALGLLAGLLISVIGLSLV